MEASKRLMTGFVDAGWPKQLVQTVEQGRQVLLCIELNAQTKLLVIQ